MQRTTDPRQAEGHSPAAHGLRISCYLCLALALSQLAPSFLSTGSSWSGGARLSAQGLPPIQLSSGPRPAVRLGEEQVAFATGTVEVPILVKNDYQADGLKISIDYDEVFLGYAWYRTTGTTWRVERVAPYGQRRMILVLKRNNKTPPADPDAEQPEVAALYAVFYLKDALKQEDRPFRTPTELSLGSTGVEGGTDSYFFTLPAGQEQYRPILTTVTNGSVAIYYRDGVEVGSGSVTKTEQLFTLPLYLTYIASADDGAGGDGGGGRTRQRTFTVGIDYDEVFLGLVSVRGQAPPLVESDSQIQIGVDDQGKTTIALHVDDAAPDISCHTHVADLIFSYNGLDTSTDHLVVEPRLIVDAPGDGAAGPPVGEDGHVEEQKTGGAGGAEPGVVSFLPAYFVRGNVDSSENVGSKGTVSWRGDQTDVFGILNAIFLGRSSLLCEDAADVNDNGKIELSDAILLLNHLFRGGPPPIGPFPNPGVDRGTEDDLGCAKPLPFFQPSTAPGAVRR